MSLFWILILFYALLSISGELEAMKYSKKVQTLPSGPVWLAQLHEARLFWDYIHTHLADALTLSKQSQLKMYGA